MGCKDTQKMPITHRAFYFFRSQRTLYALFLVTLQFQTTLAMRHILATAALLFCLLPLYAQSVEESHADDSLALAQMLPGSRVDFIENLGQWQSSVRFKASTDHGEIYLEDSCFTIVLCQKQPHHRHEGKNTFHHSHRHLRHAYRTTFVGASPTLPQGRGKGTTYDNYFIGNDPSHWASRVAHYGCVLYENLYPNIDMKVYGAENALKYDLIVRQGADPQQIAIRYEGVDRLSLRNGNLVIATSAGRLMESCPHVYQTINGIQHPIEARYQLKDNVVSFVIGHYNTSLPLIIDPYLFFSTYTGSHADNWGTTATYDSYKNTYTSGLVFNNGYPTSLGAYDSTFNGNADIGIFKFDTSGNQRIYATYIGGTYADMPHSMYVNAFDELIIFGTTGSDNFPTTPNAFDTTFHGGTPLSYLDAYQIRSIYYPNGSDIFVTRLNADGSAILASTYVGGTSNDGLNYHARYNSSNTIVMAGNDSLYFNYGDGARGEIITDNQNNVYVGTTTCSPNFPVTPNCIQNVLKGRQEGVVFKLDQNLSNMLWSTFLGGYDNDAVYSIDVDSNYNLLVCGGTSSANFPTTANAYRTNYHGGSADGFVAKISRNGDRLISSTLFGSNTYDQCYFVRSGKKNDVFILGQTKASGNTLIYNANYNTPNSGNFVARFKPNLDTLVWSTVFGTGSGMPNISPTAFAADICNRVYVCGWGRDFVASYTGISWRSAGTWGMEVTPDAIQSVTDGQDFYIMSLPNDANHLDYATFYGELNDASNSNDYHGDDHVDGGTSRFDRLATLYQSVCGGCGGSDNFPTTSGTWSETNNSSNCNNALFRFNIHDDFPVAEFRSVPVGCAPYSVDFHNSGRGAAFHWDFGDGTTSTETNPSHTYDSAGLYTVTLIASIPAGCSTADTTTGQVLVLGAGSYNSASFLSCNGEPIQIGYRPLLGATYRWIAGSVSDSTISNPWVSQSGDYMVSITADLGCSQVDTFHVDFRHMIDSIIVNHPTCPGDSNGRIVVVPNSSTSPDVRYIWDGTNTSDSIYDHLTEGFYYLTIVDGRCTTHHTFTLASTPLPNLNKEAQLTVCHDTCDAWIHLTWGNIDTVMQNLCEGIYTTLLTDTNGCHVNDTSIIVAQHALDNFHAWATDTLIFLGNSTTLHALPVVGGSYQWNPAYTLSNPQSATTLATPTDTLATYLVTATDSVGCQATDSVTIHCIEVNCGEGNVFIPNAFTPNEDGVNDKLCFRGDYVTEFHLALYSRWGELIWETNSIHDCWDGRYKDNWCLPGVYVYTCTIRCEANLTNTFKGDITLIR